MQDQKSALQDEAGDLRTSLGEVVRRVDLDSAAGTDPRAALLVPMDAGYARIHLARAALAGDQAALDAFHALIGLALPGVTEYRAGYEVRLTSHEGKHVFQAANQGGHATACIDATELVAWILSSAGQAALARRGVTVPTQQEIERLHADVDRLLSEGAVRRDRHAKMICQMALEHEGLERDLRAEVDRLRTALAAREQRTGTSTAGLSAEQRRQLVQFQEACRVIGAHDDNAGWAALACAIEAELAALDLDTGQAPRNGAASRAQQRAEIKTYLERSDAGRGVAGIEEALRALLTAGRDQHQLIWIAVDDAAANVTWHATRDALKLYNGTSPDTVLMLCGRPTSCRGIVRTAQRLPRALNVCLQCGWSVDQPKSQGVSGWTKREQ